MARVLALLAAVLLVAAAVLVRRELDADDAPASDGGDEEALVVACVPELEVVCRAVDGIDLRVEQPSATLAARGDVDAWVTFDPWPGIGEPAVEPVVAVGSIDLVLVTRTGTGCDDWTCPGAAIPDTESFGLLALGHASLEWSAEARPGEPFARQELDLPEYRAWVAGLERSTRDPLEDMLLLGPAGPRAVAALGADVADRVVGSREEANLTSTASGTLGVVVAGPEADALAGRLADALAAAGWELGAPSEGLPPVGVLRAMQDVLG